MHKFYFFVLFALGALSSCYYDKVDLSSSCTQEMPDTISFNKDIVPIFVSNCNNSNCHSGSMPAGNLNLEPAFAYARIMKKGSGYIDTINPESSLLYNQLISESNPMPPNGKLDNCQIKMILTWIQQKAKNN